MGSGGLWKNLRDFWNGNIGKFTGFQLVKSTTVNPSFTEQARGCYLVEKLPDTGKKGFILSKRTEQKGSWIHRKVHIGDSGT